MTSFPNVFEVHQFMHDKNIVFAYTGTFDHYVTTSLLKSIKRKLRTFQGPKGTHKKNYSILVESIENVSKHSSYINEKQNMSMLLLCETENQYTIITGNHILNEEVTALKERLDNISKLDTVELKKLYRNQILAKNTKNDNNAGLGILDIAIKSGNKIKYDFYPRTEQTSFYLFQTEINIH